MKRRVQGSRTAHLLARRAGTGRARAAAAAVAVAAAINTGRGIAVVANQGTKETGTAEAVTGRVRQTVVRERGVGTGTGIGTEIGTGKVIAIVRNEPTIGTGEMKVSGERGAVATEQNASPDKQSIAPIARATNKHRVVQGNRVV